MGQSSNAYHEPVESLSNDTRNMHRALVSLQEELEAVDWYNQRAEASGGELQHILLHNMSEEMEHACMLLEWIRRHHSTFDEHLRTYLFSEGPVTEREEVQAALQATASPPSTKTTPNQGTSFTIGSLKES